MDTETESRTLEKHDFIRQLKEYLERNDLVIVEDSPIVSHHMNSIKTRHYIDLFESMIKTSKDLTEELNILVFTSNDSDIEYIKKAHDIALGKCSLNPLYYYSKEGLEKRIERILSYLEYNSEEEVRKRQREKKILSDIQNKEKKEKESNLKGYVYLISDGELVKIGQTKYPKKRIIDLEIELKKELNFIHYEFVSGYRILERKLHTMFSFKRIKGEWFNLSDNDIEIAKQYLLERVA